MNPYEELFTRCEEQLLPINGIFDRHATSSWKLIKNNHHHPSRTLRQDRNPEYSIELQMCGDWRIPTVEARAFEFSVNGWSEDHRGVWHHAISYGSGPMTLILPSIESWIESAKREVIPWTAGFIEKNGKFMKYYSKAPCPS